VVNYIYCNNENRSDENMNGHVLREARERRGWTQAQAGNRLGISQAYVALLEKGRRAVPLKLAQKAVRLFKLDPIFLPTTEADLSTVTSDELAHELSRLGYPGFAYLRGGKIKNPGEVLLEALAQPELDSRIAEALPWLLLNYSGLDSEWLLTQARLLNLTNRLGFMVDLARRVAERNGETESSRYQALARLADSLRRSRLDIEDTLGQESLTTAERRWLRANRPADAEFWHLLTNWRPEFLQFTV
jgi:transcriptional regulator with XRE-family HTH domain